jgi:DivIVA domain-containing protein
MTEPPHVADVRVAALRDVTFPMTRRGYDPDAVDAYVALVTQMVDELERSDPQHAVRRALDDVGERTAGILRAAEGTAAQMIADARARTDEEVARAEARGREIIAAAERRARELDAEIERLWQERRRLLDDTQRVADALREVAAQAEQRFPAEEPGAPRLPPAPPKPSAMDEPSSMAPFPPSLLEGEDTVAMPALPEADLDAEETAPTAVHGPGEPGEREPAQPDDVGGVLGVRPVTEPAKDDEETERHDPGLGGWRGQSL